MKTEPTWKKKIADIEKTGLSIQQMADLVGMTRSAFADIRLGRTEQPTGMYAVRLHELWKTIRERRQKKRRKPN